MADTKTYIVAKSMQSGAQSYEPGDERELTPADAAHLVESGALYEKGGEPAEREPSVRHTFGEATSDAGVITLPEKAAEPKAKRTPPAKA